MTSEPNKLSKQQKCIVEYLPPSFAELNRFAKSVCKQLGTETDNDEIVQGLTDFLTIIARIKAKQMSTGIDHDQE